MKSEPKVFRKSEWEKLIAVSPLERGKTEWEKIIEKAAHNRAAGGLSAALDVDDLILVGIEALLNLPDGEYNQTYIWTVVKRAIWQESDSLGDYDRKTGYAPKKRLFNEDTELLDRPFAKSNTIAVDDEEDTFDNKSWLSSFGVEDRGHDNPATLTDELNKYEDCYQCGSAEGTALEESEAEEHDEEGWKIEDEFEEERIDGITKSEILHGIISRFEHSLSPEEVLQDKIEYHSKQKDIELALSKLGSDERQIIELHYREETPLTLMQIAEKMGVTERTIRNRECSAINSIREILSIPDTVKKAKPKNHFKRKKAVLSKEEDKDNLSQVYMLAQNRGYLITGGLVPVEKPKDLLNYQISYREILRKFQARFSCPSAFQLWDDCISELVGEKAAEFLESLKRAALDGPSMFDCLPHEARISKRQCIINQAKRKAHCKRCKLGKDIKSQSPEIFTTLTTYIKKPISAFPFFAPNYYRRSIDFFL